MTDDNQYGSLTGAIYDAAVHPCQWPETISAIREAVGGAVSVLQSRDSTLSIRHCEVSAVSEWPEDSTARYFAHYRNIDTRAPFVAALSPGQIYVDDRQMPFSAVASSELFRVFFKPLGLGYGMATPLFKTEGRRGSLSVVRPLQNGPFPQASVGLFEYLAPHVVRALQMHRQVQRAEDLARGLALTLDHYPLAVMLVAAEGRVRHMNRRAAEMLSEKSIPLRIMVDRLHLDDSSALDNLLRQIARAVALARGEPQPPCEIIKFRGADSADVVAMMVAPLRDGAHPGIVAEPLAAIFISDPSLPILLDPHALMQQFGLTPAEASMAVALSHGSSLSEISDARQVSIETVRTLLKRTMAKTESRSQGQLIARLSRSLALFRQTAKLHLR